MGYFKFTQQDKIIDVQNAPVWVCQDSRGRIVRCDVKHATGVLSADESIVYHIAGTTKLTDGKHEEIHVADITEQEFDNLSAIMGLGGTVTDAAILWEPVEPDPIAEADPVELHELKRRYISKLSADCQAAIFGGVDVELSNGLVRHFDLQLEDQINLLTLQALVFNGEKTIPYHATGCLCEYFSAEDFLRIITSANFHRNYHTAYFNSLKNWVMSLTNGTDVTSVKYGDSVPTEFCSDVYLHLEGVENS